MKPIKKSNSRPATQDTPIFQDHKKNENTRDSMATFAAINENDENNCNWKMRACLIKERIGKKKNNNNKQINK